MPPCPPLDAGRAAGLCGHLADRAESVFAVTVERFQVRVGRTLASRPRLAPSPGELSLIANYLCQYSRVEALVPQLMEELAPLTTPAPP